VFDTPLEIVRRLIATDDDLGLEGFRRLYAEISELTSAVERLPVG
jgi:hypothetical protein